MPVQHSVKLVPWDDREFVRAYERAAADLEAHGIRLHQAEAPFEIQRRLRDSGYPNATCWCERSVESVLARSAHCVVSRDGTEPASIRG